jgi:hypothetical protein
MFEPLRELVRQWVEATGGDEATLKQANAYTERAVAEGGMSRERCGCLHELGFSPRQTDAMARLIRLQQEANEIMRRSL